MNSTLTPILISASQYTQRKGSENPLDPLRLMVKTCRKVINQVNNESIIDKIDSIYMININSWSYADAPKTLSELLGINPKHKIYLPDGGDTPQMLVNRAAKAISSGISDFILITGGEARYSASKIKRGELPKGWSDKQKPKYMEGPLWTGINTFENRYGLINPPYAYALFETALRARSKRQSKEHEKFIGEIFERFSKVAAENPKAWNRTAYNADEITGPSSNNRFITYPYTKRMCSNMFVDQSAALLMTSVKLAKRLNLDESKWVYVMGGADLKDIHEITQRPNLVDSVPMRKASQLALRQAGLELEDIDAFDLYSCFPSIVQIMMKEIGISFDDSRPISLTGGMPFFGGPWSNYSMHGIVEAVKQVQENPKSSIMVVANGGYNTKKSVGIYGKAPPKIPWTDRDDSELQETLFSHRLPEPTKQANGIMTIEAYTIPYDRSGNPKYIITLGHLENGNKTLSLIFGDKISLLKFQEQELVGKQLSAKYDEEKKQNVIRI